VCSQSSAFPAIQISGARHRRLYAGTLLDGLDPAGFLLLIRTPALNQECSRLLVVPVLVLLPRSIEKVAQLL
jgi:hypothetical protein